MRIEAEGITLTPEDQALAREAVQQQIQQLREAGFEVEVVHDGIAFATVRIETAEGSMELLIDPMRLAACLRDLASRSGTSIH